MKHSLKEQVKGSLIRPLRSRVATGLSPTFKIPLIDSMSSVPSGLVSTFARNSTATYIDDDGILQTSGINVVRFQNGRYLCELAATNRFLQSRTPATQVITVVSGTVYTVQCYGSGSITLSGSGTGTVVEGAPVTFTASSTSLICAVSGSLNRAQVETGTKATSYIPTTTTPFTREADRLYYTVGDVITQGQGSLYCEVVGTPFSGVPKRFLHLSDVTNYNRIYTLIPAATNIFVAQIITNNILEVNTPGGTPNVGLNKILITYTNNNVNLYANGGLIGSDTSCAIATTMSRLNVGSTHDNLYHLNGEMGNIKYFKEVLTKAQAIKITTI